MLTEEMQRALIEGLSGDVDINELVERVLGEPEIEIDMNPAGNLLLDLKGHVTMSDEDGVTNLVLLSPRMMDDVTEAGVDLVVAAKAAIAGMKGDNAVETIEDAQALV